MESRPSKVPLLSAPVTWQVLLIDFRVFFLKSMLGSLFTVH